MFVIEMISSAGSLKLGYNNKNPSRKFFSTSSCLVVASQIEKISLAEGKNENPRSRQTV